MAVVFKNNAKTTLASGINSSATSITVSDGSVFPSLTGSDIFFVTFDDGTNNEIVKVTARSGNTLTVVRAQESTTARSFSTGDEAQLRLTAGILGLFSQTGVAITDEIEAYLDANGLTFPDSVIAKFGSSNDLKIQHNGTNSFIDNETGGLYIRQKLDDGDVLIQSDNGSGGLTNYFRADGSNGQAQLFHYGSQKLNTTSSGVNIIGGLDVGTVDMDGFTSVGNGTITGDLLIQEGSGFPRITLKDTDGTNTQSFINHSGSDLTLTTQNGTANGRLIFARYNGTTTTTSGYFDANGKFFLNGNVDISGTISSGDITVNTNGRIGTAGGETFIAHNGTTDSGIRFRGSGEIIPATFAGTGSNGVTDLGSAGFRFRNLHLSGTISSGAITSTGNSQLNGDVQIGDTVNQNAFGALQLNQTANNDEEGIGILSSGAARSMRLWVDETSSYINSGNGGSANLIFNEAITVSSGGNLTGVGTIGSGQITITQNHPTVFLQTSGGTTNDAAYLQKYNNDLYLYNKESAGSLFLGTNNSTQVTINSSGNATFAGTISSGAITSSGNVAGATMSTTGDIDFGGRTQLRKDLRIRGDGSSANLGVVRLRTNSSNTFFIDPANDGNNVFTFDSNGNLTVPGTISGTLASSVIATTQSAGDNSTKVATTAYTDTAIANLADSAPSTLNTLNELAAALGDDANFSTTVTNSIATKLPLAGGTMTGDLNMGSKNITNIQNIRNNDIDFIVQDTTDSVTNFIWRDHSASKLYLGTADAKVELRSNLNLQSGHNIQMNGTAVMSSGRALTNITGFSGTSTTNNGYDFNCTDSTGDAGYTGMIIDHNVSGTDTLTADRTHRGLYVDQDSSATGGDTSNEHRLYGIQVATNATGDSDLLYAINTTARAQHSSGTISAVRGGNFTGVGDTTSTASQIVGVVGTAQKTIGGTVNSLYGVFGKSHILSTNTTTNSMSAFGLYGEVELDSNTTLTNADAVRAVIDRDAGTITNGYLFRGSYEGTRPTNAFGVYITSDVVNYFAGSVSIGHNTPDQNGLNVHMTDAEVVINDTNNTPVLRLRESGTTKAVITTSSGALTLSSGGSTVALTLDTSQNATFAGNVEVGSNTLNFADNGKARFGNSTDLQIYHDGSNSYIQSKTGNFNLTTDNGNEFALTAVNNGAVSLFHNGSTKLSTSSSGIDVTGTINASGQITQTVAGSNYFRSIASSSGNAGLYMQNTARNWFVLNNSAGTFEIYDGTASATRMQIDASGNIKVGTTTFIDSSRKLINTTLGHATDGARFETNDWMYDTSNERRLYFETNNRTFYAAHGHHFRNSSNVTKFTISNSNGGININSGDTQVGSTVAIGVAGTTVLDTSRNLTNIGTISSGAITASSVNSTSGDVLVNSKRFVRQKSYSGTGDIGTSGSYYTLFYITEHNTPSYITLKMGAHSTQTFVVTTGYHGSNVAHVQMLSSTYTQNGGYPGVSAVRILKDSNNSYRFQVKLTYSSGPVGFSLEARAFGSTNAADVPSFQSSLTVDTTTGTTIEELETGFTGSANSGQNRSDYGSSSAPAYSFKEDSDTGIYRQGSNSLGLVQGAVERLRIGSDVSVLGATDFHIAGSNRRLSFTSGTGTIRTTTANSLILATNSTTALTLDSSQNATFAGNITASGKISGGGNVDTTPDADLHIRTSDLGGTSGDQQEIARFQTNLSNGGIVRVYTERHTTGTDWTSAQTKIQQRIDSTDMGYILFNGSGNTYGVELGTHATAGTVNLRHRGTVRLNTVNAGVRVTGQFQIGTTTVIDSARNLTNIGTISSGGHTLTSGNLQINDDEGRIRFASSLNWDIQPETSDASLRIKTSSGANRVVFIENTGSGNLNLNVDGLITSSASNVNGALTVTSGDTSTFAGTDYLNINANVGNVNTNGSHGLHIGWNKSNGGREINMIFDGGTAQADTEMIFTSTDGTTYTDIFQINGAVGTGVDIKSGGLRIGTTTVIDGSRNLTNIGTIASNKITATGGDDQSSTGVLELATSGGTNLKLGGNTNYSWIQSHASKPLYINELGNDVIINSGGGDVAIGSTSTPSNIKLYVNGAMRVDNAEGIAAKKIRSSYFSANQDLTLETHSSSDIIMDTGKVGINDATPSQTLDINGNLGIGGTEVISSSRNLTNIGTISSGGITTSQGNITIGVSGTPALILDDTGNAGGGAASGIIKFKNTAGAAMGIGYTSNSTADSDMIISTNAGGTYGGYLGLASGAISDAQSDIILEPKTNVRIATGSLEMGTTVFIDQSRNLTNIGTVSCGKVSPVVTASGQNTALALKTQIAGDQTGTLTCDIDFFLHDSNTQNSTPQARIGITGSDVGNQNAETGGRLGFYTTDENYSSPTLSKVGQFNPDKSLVCAGDITAFGSPSDIRLKENIENITDPVTKIKKLNGVTFNYKDTGKKSTGLIAQELEKVLPEVVYETESLENSEDKYKAVRYGNVVGLLVEAIKEQQDQIEYMKSEIKTLKEANNGNK